MVSISSSTSTYSTALTILRSGPGNASASNESADLGTGLSLMNSIIKDYGLDENGNLWLPDTMIRTASLSGGGVIAFTGADALFIGTGGNDLVNGGNGSVLYGGDGNDGMHADYYAEIYGGAGNDSVQGQHRSTASGGTGNDRVGASFGSYAYGDEGNDYVSASNESWAYGGDGNDTMRISSNSYGEGGSGNDTFEVRGRNNTVSGGTGDDTFDLTHTTDKHHDFIWNYAGTRLVPNKTPDTGTLVKYNAGDGNDTIVLGDYWQQSRAMGVGPTSTISLGYGLIVESTTIEIDGNQAVISFAGNESDSITVKFEGNSRLVIAFADGTNKEIEWNTGSGMGSLPDPITEGGFVNYNEF